MGDASRGARSPGVVSLGSVVRAAARRRLACGARRPLFSDIVEAGGRSPLSARSASFGAVGMRVGIGWTVPRLGGGRARRRFAGRLVLVLDAVIALYAAHFCPNSDIPAHRHGRRDQRRRTGSQGRVTEHPGPQNPAPKLDSRCGIANKHTRIEKKIFISPRAQIRPCDTLAPRRFAATHSGPICEMPAHRL